jgi:hypothetical protein
MICIFLVLALCGGHPPRTFTLEASKDGGQVHEGFMFIRLQNWAHASVFISLVCEYVRVAFPY